MRKKGIHQINDNSVSVAKDQHETKMTENLFDSLRCLPEEVKIKLRPDAEPVVEPCSVVPLKIQEKNKRKSPKNDDGIITPVEAPTDWVHAMHVVTYGKLRICLDLNKTIKREHFKLPTHEDIMSRFAGAKMCSKLDSTKCFDNYVLMKKCMHIHNAFCSFSLFRTTIWYNQCPRNLP